MSTSKKRDIRCSWHVALGFYGEGRVFFDLTRHPWRRLLQLGEVVEELPLLVNSPPNSYFHKPLSVIAVAFCIPLVFDFE